MTSNCERPSLVKLFTVRNHNSLKITTTTNLHNAYDEDDKSLIKPHLHITNIYIKTDAMQLIPVFYHLADLKPSLVIVLKVYFLAIVANILKK